MSKHDNHLHELCEQVVGKEIWHVGTSEAAGNSFSLALGGRVPREARLKGATDDEFSASRGEFGLYVWCTWRLETGLGVASSDQSQVVFQRELKRLLFEKVRAFSVRGRFCDLVLRTDNCVLQAFCDHMPPDSSFDGNWELEYPGGALNVGPGDRVEIEVGMRQGESD